jgi:hypothetical protein
MNEKIKQRLNVILNIFIFVAILSITYSWMLTSPSRAELVDYNKNLVIVSSDVEVAVYAYRNAEYVEETTSPMLVELLAPGIDQKFRFDVTNNNDVQAITKIVFSNITGDIDTVKDYVVFGSTSPIIKLMVMGEGLMYNEIEERHYVNFFEEFRVPANQTVSLYWYITIAEEATNEIGDTSFGIERIMFIKP